MQIVDTILRAVVERVTEIHGVIDGDPTRLYVFEHLDKQGRPVETWIQNWECEDITNNLTWSERKEIFEAVENHYKKN